MPDPMVRSTLPPAAAGRPLHAYLTARFRYLDEDGWAREIAAGRVWIDGVPGNMTTPLQAGSELAWQRPNAEPWVRDDITILHEDADLVVIDKPPHLPVHADGAFIHNTAIGLLERLGQGRLRAVHRLDRETSGVLVLARTKHAARELTRAFRAAEVHKTYVAIVEGPLSAARLASPFTIDAPIGRCATSAVSIRRSAQPGAVDPEPAETRVEVITATGSLVALRLYPRTGRTHQLRVHLESVGHPIVGDKMYGQPDDTYLAFVYHVKAGGKPNDTRVAPRPGRCLLHAESLEVTHPRTGEIVRWEAPWPADLRAASDRDEL